MLYLSPLTVRLKSRGVTNLGTVEIRTEAGWVQVCDDDWDREDALVVCREQNFNNGTALIGSKLGKISTHDSMPNVAFRLVNLSVVMSFPHPIMSKVLHVLMLFTLCLLLIINPNYSLL